MTAIDWALVRRRIEEAIAATEQADGARAQSVLAERARALAEPPREPERTGSAGEVVTLTLGGQRCAIESRWVAAILDPPALTPIPGTGPALIGVAKVRGAVLAVFDAAFLLHGTTATRQAASRVVALGAGAPELGILADEVEGMARMAPGGLLPPPGGDDESGIVRGLTADGRLMLDGGSLLSDRRFFVGAEPDRARE